MRIHVAALLLLIIPCLLASKVAPAPQTKTSVFRPLSASLMERKNVMQVSNPMPAVMSPALSKREAQQGQLRRAAMSRGQLVELIESCIAEPGSMQCDLVQNADTSEITDMAEMFFGSRSAFTGDISKWDVSAVKTMRQMFDQSAFTGDISKWDVSAVNDMSFMFRSSSFTGNISGWDVSSVTTMAGMFQNSPFTGDISKWDVSAVKDMGGMFQSASFTGDISKWDVSAVNDMSGMFYGSSFNGNIANWNVSAVKDMAYMFSESSFNGNIANWEVSAVKDMSEMFAYSSFNGNIANWDVSAVKDMSRMFEVSSFTGDLSKWDVSAVNDMSWMFAGSSFNGEISKWDVSSVTDMEGMFSGSSFDRYGDICQWDLVKTTDVGCLAATCGRCIIDGPTCFDGIRNQDEETADCGGVCGSCELQCTIQLNDKGVQFTTQDVCEPGELKVIFNESEALGAHVCFSSGDLDEHACPGLKQWVYKCQAGQNQASTECTQEFLGVARLCKERSQQIIVPANLQRILDEGTLEYDLSDAEYRDFPNRLSLGAAKDKFVKNRNPKLKIVVIDTDNESEEWKCGGELDGGYITLGEGTAVKTLIPFVYLALSTMLTMAGEAIIDLGDAFAKRDLVRLGVIGLDALFEVIGGALFVTGIQTAEMTVHKKIDHCTIAGSFDSQEFTLGQGCGGLESMRELGIALPDMCARKSVLTHTGLIMGLLDIFVGIVIVAIFWKRRDKEGSGPPAGADQPRTEITSPPLQAQTEHGKPMNTLSYPHELVYPVDTA